MKNKIKYKIDSDISKARTLHSDYYTDNKMFSESIDNIFQDSWQLVAHRQEFKNKNVIPITILPQEPLILTKDNSDIHCISNVCTHRGHIVCDKKKFTKSMVCRYHGRSFTLDGKFKNAIGFEGVKDFPSESDNLKPIHIKEWKDFILVSLKNKIDISNILHDIETRLESFPFDKIKFSEELSATYEINNHWALYCENYLEGFHVPFIHKGLNKDIDLKSYKTKLLENGVLQFANDALSKNSKTYAYYYWIFPNLMLNFYDWGLSINIIEPINKEKTRVKFLSYPIKGMKQPQDSNASIDKVELEDQAIVINVQKGIKSKAYKKGRYSVKYERGLHYFHQLLTRYLS